MNPQSQQLQAADSVYALACSPGVCFAARASGLYRSYDGGQTWAAAYTTLDITEALTTTAVVVHGQYVFAGVKGGILRSADAGQNWIPAILPPPAPLISALSLSPNFAEDGVIVAGTAEDGVFVSTDRGSHWTPWNFGLLDLNVFAVAFSPDFASDQTIFVGSESGIFRSKNGGRAWRPVPFPMDAAPVLSLGFANDLMFAGTESTGLYLSRNRGDTWEQVAQDSIDGAVNAVAASDGTIWLLLDDRVVCSEDKGQSWSVYSTGLPDESHALAMVLAPTQPLSVLVGMADGTLLPLP